MHACPALNHDAALPKPTVHKIHTIKSPCRLQVNHLSRIHFCSSSSSPLSLKILSSFKPLYWFLFAFGRHGHGAGLDAQTETSIQIRPPHPTAGKLLWVQAGRLDQCHQRIRFWSLSHHQSLETPITIFWSFVEERGTFISISQHGGQCLLDLSGRAI